MEKEKYIHMRIDENTKKQFDTICKMKAINGSELVRQWIRKYIEKNSHLIKQDAMQEEIDSIDI